MKQNINMKDQLSDIQSIIWGCPVRILMHLLRLMLVNYHLKLLTQGDIQILIQLTPAECCVPGAAKLSQFTSLLSARMLDEKRHKWGCPYPIILCGPSILLGTSVIMAPFEEWGPSLLFYISLHIVSCAGSCTLWTSVKNPGSLLLVIVTYRISSGSVLPSLFKKNFFLL